MRFNPVLDRKDLSMLLEGQTAKEVEKEQRLVEEAQVIIFIYPIWWFGMPAIMKGYIDRVFVRGFAFAIEENGLKGLLTGKRVITRTTPRGSECSRSSRESTSKRFRISYGIIY